MGLVFAARLTGLVLAAIGVTSILAGLGAVTNHKYKKPGRIDRAFLGISDSDQRSPAVVNCSMTRSRENVAAFWPGGYSAKVCRNCPT